MILLRKNNGFRENGVFERSSKKLQKNMEKPLQNHAQTMKKSM
jgi:hypothetical protein